MVTMRNRARCKNCGDVIESKQRHEFVSCTCFKDTGRRVGDVQRRVVDMIEEWMPEPLTESQLHAITHYVACASQDVLGRGFFLDGGSDYNRAGGNFDDMEWIIDEKDQ